MICKATIDLTDVVDLTDVRYWGLFQRVKSQLGKPAQQQLGPEALFRSLSAAEQDQLYLNYEDDYYISAFVALLENEGQTVKSIRAAFIEGSPIHDRSWLFDRAHVQICVRSEEAIQNIEWIV